MTPTTLAPVAAHVAAAPVEAAHREVLALVEKCLEIQARATAQALKPLIEGPLRECAVLVQRAATRAANLAWALTRFPRIDPVVITMTKKATIKIGSRWSPTPDDPEVTCHVPAFGVELLHLYPDGLVRRFAFGALTYDSQNPLHLGHVSVPWGEFTKQFTPGGELSGKWPNTSGNAPIETGALLARRPSAVPEPISEQVRPHVERFDEIALLYEAEWRGAPEGRDPLVIGVIHLGPTASACFVLAAYDQTSLEAYIGREFATGPAATA